MNLPFGLASKGLKSQKSIFFLNCNGFKPEASGNLNAKNLMKNNKLDRRNFLKTTAVGAAGLSLMANSTANAAADPILKLPEGLSTRRILPLNHNWLYSEKSSPEATKPGFNDR